MVFFLYIRKFFSKGLKSNLRVIGFAFLVLVALGTIGSYFSEHSANPGFRNLWDTFWWTIVTVATVGYGDKVPLSVAGKILGIVCMLGGPLIMASTFGAVGINLYNRWMKGERGMSQIKSKNHLVICGWNAKANNIIDEIRLNEDLKSMPVTIIDDAIETRPVEEPSVSFVRGNAAETEVLHRANIGEARYAIVLASDSSPQADQKTVLVVLAIERENPAVITSAEINDMDNAVHLKRAGCDIIVNSPDLTSRMLAMSIQNSSITEIITDLVSGEGNELYRNAVPPRYAGKNTGSFCLN